jgi:hypothetical protein
MHLVAGNNVRRTVGIQTSPEINAKHKRLDRLVEATARKL